VPITGLFNPVDVAVDPAGDVFVADQGEGVIKYTPGQGQVTLAFPTNVGGATAVGVDPAGDVFAGFRNGNVVGTGSLWEIPNGGTARQLPVTGLTDPDAIAMADNTVGYVSDFGSLNQNGGLGGGGGVISYSTSGTIANITGSLRASGVAYNPITGLVYYTDFDGGALYKSNGVTVGTPVSAPDLTFPFGVAVDPTGDVFVGNVPANHQIIELPAGGGELNLPFAASVSSPALDAAGDVFATDGQKVFELPVVPPSGTMSANASSGAPGAVVSVTSVTPCPPASTSVSVSLITDNKGDEAGTTSLGVGDTALNWAIHFTVPPVAAGGQYFLHAKCFEQTEGATFVDQTYSYLPFTVNAIATKMTLASSPNAPKFGDPVRLFASLTPAASTNARIGGSVAFFDSGTNLGTVTVVDDFFNPTAGATASLTASALLVGTHTITAKYSGNGTFTPSSATTTVTITKSPTVVTVAPATRSAHQYSAVVSVPPPSGRPAALIERAVPGVTVTFSVATLGGSTELCHAVTNFAGRAACSAAVPMLAMGDGSYTATFAGNAEYTGSSNVGRLS
jgi:hypothetical protein